MPLRPTAELQQRLIFRRWTKRGYQHSTYRTGTRFLRLEARQETSLTPLTLRSWKRLPIQRCVLGSPPKGRSFRHATSRRRRRSPPCKRLTSKGGCQSSRRLISRASEPATEPTRTRE